MAWTRGKLLAAVGLLGTAALGGCAYDDGYGYGGVSVGTGYYGGGYYGDGYYGSPYGYGYGYYGGWNDGFYYPGSGYYVYDRGGRRHRWNDGQQRYWEGRRNNGGGWRDHDRDHDGRPDWRNGQAGRPQGDRNGDGRPDWRGRDGRNWNNGQQRPAYDPAARARWQQQRSDPGANAVSPRAQRAPSPGASQPRWGGGEGRSRGDGGGGRGGRRSH